MRAHSKIDRLPSGGSQVLPQPRGEVSDCISSVLRTDPQSSGLEDLPDILGEITRSGVDVLYNDDLQTTLYMLYELHYRGFEQVDDRWEWNPALLFARSILERAFENRLRAEYLPRDSRSWTPQEVAETLFQLTETDDSPSVSAFVQRRATVEQAREFLVHKSIYQLKEADPHTWAIPRLEGSAKSALIEIQVDEYGNGRPGRMHSELFARTMQGLKLENRPGYYVDYLPAITLASVNAMSLFGLHRRLRGAIVGHLATYEMTSSLPNAKYARGFRRLGFADDVIEYFDEHVEADAVHEQIAGRDLAGGLIAADPSVADSVFFGATAVTFLDAAVSKWQLDAWADGRSSLRIPLSTNVGHGSDESDCGENRGQ